MISEPTIKNRAAGGARFLDEVDPGWHQRVDPDLLDMSVAWIEFDSGCGCVLAQLDGKHFQGGLRQYNIQFETSTGLGFTFETPDFDYTSQWEKLTDAWRTEILSRRKEEATT